MSNIQSGISDIPDAILRSFWPICYAVLHLLGGQMEHIPHRDFRNQSSDVLRRVESGESIAITNHGKPVAVLHPLSEIGTAITPRSTREAFAVERFTVPDVAADLLGLLLAARGTSR